MEEVSLSNLDSTLAFGTVFQSHSSSFEKRVEMACSVMVPVGDLSGCNSCL